MNYFDFNATTPVCEEALDAWVETARQFPGNPSSLHRVGRRADHVLEESRALIANCLDCLPGEILFTSGATESNNMVFHFFSRRLSEDAEVWISAVEHPCVQRSASRWFGSRVRTIPVTERGVVDMSAFSSMLKQSTPGLVSVMAANNETGMLQPWQEVRDLCQSHGIPFHCDAAQWLGKMPARGLGKCDFVSAAAHKFSGPKGCGFLKLPADCGWIPLIVGGGQEDGRRAGTENVQSIRAMAVALQTRNNQLTPEFLDRQNRARLDFLADVLDSIPGTAVVGDPNKSLWNTLMIQMPETDCRQRWVVKLDKAGFAVSSGSACSSGEEKPSMVLTAMGLSPSEAGRALRFSAGWDTSTDDWNALLLALKKVHDELMESVPGN
jgi:cysteine desulfurase